MKVSNVGKNGSQAQNVDNDETDVDLTFSISQMVGIQTSPLMEAALGSKAFDAANDESSFSKRPERVRSYSSVTAPGQPGVVRHENTGDE